METNQNQLQLLRNDVKILSKYLKLKPEVALSLFEEENDVDSILSAIAQKIPQKEYKSLSPNMLSKIIVYRFAIDKCFQKSEKDFISRLLAEVFPKLKTLLDKLPIVNYKSSEQHSKHNLIVCGLLGKDYGYNHVLTIRNGLSNNLVSQHVEEWLNILHKIGFTLSKCKLK